MSSDRVMSSSSPPAPATHRSPSDAATQDDDPDRAGYSTINVFRNLVQRRSTRVDGTEPRKRGPKPDAKPALTRRQELNRQAQRTHRERKEHYVKALEDEVLRLKAAFTASEQEREKQAEENRHLKELLAAHGIPLQQMAGGSETSYAPGSHSTISMSPGTTATPPGASSPIAGRGGQQQLNGQHLQSLTQQASTSKGVDYNQAGIDFVLTLERPCMEHLPYLAVDSSITNGHPAGHCLMASCPTQPWASPLEKYAPSSAAMDTSTNARMPWEVNKADLGRLLDLSPKMDVDGEITPVSAWCMLMRHPRFLELDLRDVEALSGELSRRVKCYGFGATMEEFEVRDAMESVLSQKASPAIAPANMVVSNTARSVRV